jgi:DHA2 family multidrug resistance protein
MNNVKPINKWLITITVMLPTIMEIVDTSVANVALPHMQGSLNAGTDEITCGRIRGLSIFHFYVKEERGS